MQRYLTLCLALCSSMTWAAAPAVQPPQPPGPPIGQMPQAPGGQPPMQQPQAPAAPAPGAMPQQPAEEGQPPAPSEEEMRQMEEALAQMSPEEQQELEELGRQLINNMSDDELQELADMFGTTPEELRQEAQQPAAAEEGQEPKKAPEKPKEPPRKAQKQELYISEKEARRLITQMIDVLTTLIQKAQEIPEQKNTSATVMQEMQDIVAYLKIIRDKEQIKRLTGTEYKDMIAPMQKMLPQLQEQEPRIVVPEEETELTTAYETLGVSPQATQEDITNVYQKLKEEHDPDRIAKRMQEQGATPREIRLAQRDAELAFADIQKAYDDLKDQRMLTQKQREEQARKQQQQKAEKASQAAQKEVVNTITNAVYQEKLIQQLEAFLKAYEPEALRKKQELEKAEEQRKKEMRELEKRRAEQAPARGLEPRVQAPKQQQGPPKGGAPAQPGQPGQTQQQGKKGEQQQQQPDGKKGTGSGQDQKQSEQKQDGKGKQDKKEQKQQQGGAKKDQKESETALSGLQNDLDTFAQQYKNAYKNTFTQLKNINNILPQNTSTEPSNDTKQKLQKLAEDLQQFTQDAQLDQLQQRVKNIARIVMKLTQNQQQTWNNKIAPRIKDALRPAHNTLTQAQEELEPYSSLNDVKPAYDAVRKANEKIQPVRDQLDTYNSVAQTTNFTQDYAGKLTQSADWIKRQTGTLSALPPLAEKVAQGSSQPQDLSNELKKIQDNTAIEEAQQGASLSELAKTLHQGGGQIPQDQHNTWKQQVQKEYIEAFTKLRDTLNDAYNKLTNNLTEQQKKQNEMQNLVTTLKELRDATSTITDITEQINKDVQAASQTETQQASQSTQESAPAA